MRLKKFKNNENPLSTQFTKKLNALIKEIDRANNISFSVKGGRGSIINSSTGHSLNLSLPKLVISEEEASAAAATEFVIITESLSYPSNNDISKYTVNDDIDDPSSGEEFEIDNVLGYGENLDMRDFFPWLQVDKVVPIIRITVDEIEYIYFWQTFTYIGDEDARSLAWLEDVSEEDNTPRLAAVFR